jgi:signal peptide peptidase SppA
MNFTLLDTPFALPESYLTNCFYNANPFGQAQPVRSTSTDDLSVIPVHGVITPRDTLLSAFFGGSTTSSILTGLRKALASPASHILLDINSPGGAVYGITEVWRAIMLARKKKTIIAQIDPVGTSAAYWIASAANEIRMTPSGEAGSVGVYVAHHDVSRALESTGEKVTLISAGPHKVEGNPFEPLQDEPRAFMQKRVNEYYSTFLENVAEGRGSSVSKVSTSFGGGRAYGAQEAKRLHMVDEVSSTEDTLRYIAKQMVTQRAHAFRRKSS